MTTNTIPPTLTLATLPLGGAPALAVPPSGELAVPPDFALALAELVAAPADGTPRPKLADPGKVVPVNLADTGIAAIAGALPEGELLTLPESGDPQPVVAAKPKETGDDDATLDPALSWLIAPPLAAPVAAAVIVPVAVEVAAADPVDGAAVAAKRPAVMADLATAQDPAAKTVSTDPRLKPPALASSTPVPHEIVAAAPSAPFIADETPAAEPLPTPAVAMLAAAAEPVTATPASPAAIATPAPKIDPQLAKVLADTPAIKIARPLPTPPRFVETRITPTIVASPVVASTPAAAAPPAIEPEVIAVSEHPPVSMPEKTVAQGRDGIPAAAAVASQQQPTASPPTAPTLAAIGAAAARPLPRPLELRPLADNSASLFAAALTHAATAPTAVQPTVDTQSPGMDLTRDTGLERMIDRIEMLRDDADSRDTRIRLVPDALGPVEVSVRRDGDAVRVHFIADQPATRTLIAEAQPRLTELAEARGIRISQASVDTGSASDGHARPQPQQAAQPPVTPRPARTETTDSGDERIA